MAHGDTLTVQVCSVELSCENLAIAAATLANSGVCPLTGQRVFSPETVTLVVVVDADVCQGATRVVRNVLLRAKRRVR